MRRIVWQLLLPKVCPTISLSINDCLVSQWDLLGASALGSQRLRKQEFRNLSAALVFGVGWYLLVVGLKAKSARLPTSNAADPSVCNLRWSSGNAFRGRGAAHFGSPLGTPTARSYRLELQRSDVRHGFERVNPGVARAGNSDLERTGPMSHRRSDGFT